jgi:hypothetical protein
VVIDGEHLTQRALQTYIRVLYFISGHYTNQNAVSAREALVKEHLGVNSLTNF